MPSSCHEPSPLFRVRLSKARRVMSSVLGGALLSLAVAAQAESGQQTGGSPTTVSASAHLDFRIVIPKVLILDAASDTWRTNARADETVLVAAEQGSMHRTLASRADRMAVHRLGAGAPGFSRSLGPVSYTTTMP
jgi:hypothetical protein